MQDRNDGHGLYFNANDLPGHRYYCAPAKEQSFGGMEDGGLRANQALRFFPYPGNNDRGRDQVIGHVQKLCNRLNEAVRLTTDDRDAMIGAVEAHLIKTFGAPAKPKLQRRSRPPKTVTRPPSGRLKRMRLVHGRR